MALSRIISTTQWVVGQK